MSRTDNAGVSSRLVDAAAAAAWLREIRQTIIPALVGEDAVRIALVESRGDAPDPELVDGAITLDVFDAVRSEPWSTHVGTTPSAVIVDVLSVRASRKHVAFALAAAREANPGSTFVLLAAASQLGSSGSTQLRSLLANELSLDWIVWCERPPLSLAIAVAQARSSSEVITRLVDARGVATSKIVSLIESCRRRPGGRRGREAVHRGMLPIHQPWTWWDLSPEAAAEREDVRAFGEARALSQIADIISRPPPSVTT
jgi:hypothetical protein